MNRLRAPAGLLALLCFLVPSPASAAPGQISTVYGGPIAAASPPISVALFQPMGLDLMPDGSVLLAEYGHNAVHRIDTAGSMRQIAGNGSKWCTWYQGRFAGDGPATATELCMPSAVAHDPTGRYVYFADTYNQRVRRVDLVTGDLVTVAGGGVDAPLNLPSLVVDGVPATAAALHDPSGVAVDAQGNLFVSDTDYGRVRRIDRQTGLITTFAGGGLNVNFVASVSVPAVAISLRYPSGLAFDAQGNLLIADKGHSRIVRVTPGGAATVVAGIGEAGFSGDGGIATAATLDWPQAVATDASGNVFIADTNNDRIRRVDASTGVINTIAGGGDSTAEGIVATSANVVAPQGIAATPEGLLLVSTGRRVRRIAAGVITTIAGNGQACHSGEGGPATQARMCTPRGIAVDAVGNTYIADHYGHRIVKVSASGIASTLVGDGFGGSFGDGGPANLARVQYPYGMAIDEDGNLLIADMGNDRIRRVDLHADPPAISTIVGTGGHGFYGDEGPASAAQLNRPYDVTVDTAGNLFIADLGNARVRRVDAVTGSITTVAGNGTTTIDGDGGPAIEAGVDEPTDVAVDAAGNLYIGEAWRNVVRKVDPSGTITRFAGDGYYAGAGGRYNGDGIPATLASLDFPIDVVVDSAGTVYISDGSNSRVRRVNAMGIIETVIGNGLCRYSGDGGPASQAGICFPDDLAFDAAGNLYITDYGDAVARKIEAPF